MKIYREYNAHLYTFLIFLLLHSPAYSQVELSYVEDLQVIRNGDLINFPFAGGVNSGQYGAIDLDNDGLMDLVIFDRSSDKINTFINTGSEYRYDPGYEYFLPEGIRNWIVFADYDCDGLMDIFTHSNLGIRVFRNTSTSDFTTWETAVDPLLTLGTSSKINLFLNATDVPSVSDLDGDGDLDILVYNFAAGAFIEHHKNFSIERTGNCGSLDFERISRTFGNVEECTCEEFAFGGQPCSGNGRTQHAGGKTILTIDRDGDGDQDVIIGQELCDDIYYLENKGSANIAIFDEYTDAFPAGAQLDFVTFPAPYYEDFDFDGRRDLVIAPNLRANPGNLINFQQSSLLYKNIGTGSIPEFQFIQNDFLQGDMIDVGEFAYPSFADFDGDGDEDLIIGNLGAHRNGTFLGTLTAYRNNGTTLEWVTDDLFGLSQFDYQYIKPNFVDYSGDGKKDLIFTGLDENNSFRYYFLVNNSSGTSMEFDLSTVSEIPLVLSPSDDPMLFDVDGDGLLDILMGRSNGRLEYHRNTGTLNSASFDLVDDTFLGLEFSSANSNLSIALGDFDNDGTTDLLTTDRSGVMKIYLDFVNNQEQTPIENLVNIEISGTNHSSVFGRHTKPAVTDLYGNGNVVVAVGSIQGGVRLLQTGEGTAPLTLQLSVFPNPTTDKVAQFVTPNENMQLEIFTVSGKRIFGPFSMSAGQAKVLDLTNYRNGLYIARIRKGNRKKSVKFLLNDTSAGL